ncbi:hypothetical protein ACFQS1_14065 [Paractinoplanes rhizophilus]|uniref:Fusaric acid resistance family protein n=1 Tax=Paractinoplanes rhizophilus TaxID=1416877 RepID=A0ABW2HRI3_9ACTN|nr:hypothetical protein [Actinoplanes sp.]
MTVTPRRAASTSRATRTRVRRAGAAGAGRHATAVRVNRPRHAAEPPPDLGEIAAPALDSARRGARRAPARRAYLGAAFLRCALYLAPLSVAIAAGGSLGQVAWPVPLTTLLLGWTAAQALTCAGVTVARRAGVSAACRLVAAGFGAVAGLWCALVWIAPAPLLGPHRGLALVVGLGGLATLATVTATLVTRAEAAVVRWCVPCWLLAAATLAGTAGAPVSGLPIGTLLPAAIVVALVRAFRPAMLPGSRRRFRLTGPEVRRAGGYLVIGASQAICVGLIWRAGPSGSTAPFWLPLLLAVPILEALIGWNTEAGHDPGARRGVTAVTLAGLLPPLAIGGALALAADETAATEEVLALAGGTLLGGVFAITYLLAARGRTGIAAAVAIAPPLLTPALKTLAAGLLPDAVGALAVTHVAGLLAVALTARDHRRAP